MMPLRKVALVTGPNTRAEYDFRSRLTGGRATVDVRLFPVHLRDATDIAEGIRRAADDEEVDAIVIMRGGGAPYDLHHFNQPMVLEAIAAAACRKFVLTAIGHAQDETLADRLASHSEPVPTAAATYLNRRLFEHCEKAPRDAVSRRTDVSRARGVRRWPNQRVVPRIRNWFRRWIRRTTIFAVGVLFGAFASPAFLFHTSRKQPNPAMLQGAPATGSLPSSGRHSEAKTGGARQNKVENRSGGMGNEETPKSSRR